VSAATNSTLRRAFDLTSFIGRHREIAAVQQLLRSSRLVTLTGIGGVGKTRLALRVAAQMERVYADGVWLVELAPLQDPELVPQAVVAALGMRDATSTRPLVALAEFLGHRQTLLVLDNCEHLIDASAALADTLLRRAPELRILVTSRQPLGVPGEHIFAVQPLPTPDPDGPLPPAEALARYDAVALLFERAQAAEPSFAITPDNAEAVTRLVQRLEGVPLALELAAARLRVLTPPEILDRLDDRYELLTSTARTVSPRQQSLQALIDWSFDLCTEQERLLWARLSVFPRDFVIDAAEEICADDELPRERILFALSGLVDKSIVVAEERGAGKRHRLPETLRQYARTRLVRMDSEREIRRRHRGYYRRLAAQSNEEWFGPRQAEWMAWTDAEYLNLRAALEFCLTEPGQAVEGLTMAARLSAHWVVSGSLGEGRRFLDRVLAAHVQPSAGRAMALWIAGILAFAQGDVDRAEAAAEESHVLAREYGDPRGLSFALGLLGDVRAARGEATVAERMLTEAVGAAQNEPLATSLALISAGRLAADRGDVATAKERLDRCLAICSAHGESDLRGNALWRYAMLVCQEGDVAGAKDRAMEALRLVRATGNRLSIAQCLEVLGWVAAAESDNEHAARLLGAAGALREALAIPLFESMGADHQRCEHQVCRALGKRPFEKAFHEGSRLALDDAVSRALGERVDSPLRPTDTEAAVLTRREREIADLVAQGLTNKDIAATLVISRRTAESHVEHILTKLGFSSRSQIAAWVAEKRT
jgi:predicted ATPase/DNA-binding CsgD family transcriptional regulator